MPKWNMGWWRRSQVAGWWCVEVWTDATEFKASAKPEAVKTYGARPSNVKCQDLVDALQSGEDLDLY